MNTSIRHTSLLLATLIASSTLAGCGNKGPLVKASAMPAPAPVAVPAIPDVANPADKPVADPAATPAAESPADTPDTPR